MKRKIQEVDSTFHDGVLADCVKEGLGAIARRNQFLDNMKADIENLEKLLSNAPIDDNCIIVTDDDENRYGIEWCSSKKRIIVSYGDKIKPLIEFDVKTRTWIFHQLPDLLKEIWQSLLSDDGAKNDS